MKRAIHYINQFFAGLGGEDTADHRPELHEGTMGPGKLLNAKLDAEVSHTVLAGDNYMGSNTEEALDEIKELLKDIEFDIFIAGPTFQAGRYGVAAGNVCKMIEEEFGVPAITSMHPENPGVEMFKSDLYIFKGNYSAASMAEDIEAMANFANKLLADQPNLGAEAEGYYTRGIRKQVWHDDRIPAARRGVDMLIKKMYGEDFETELKIPEKDIVPIAKPIQDLTKARVAVLDTGGIVPVDNPDRIQSASATKWGRYNEGDSDRLEAGVYKTIHSGFDPAAANADPNRIVPWDVLKDMEKEGVFGSLHPYFYSTVGTGTTQAEAARMAKEIIPYLEEDKVDAVLMVST